MATSTKLLPIHKRFDISFSHGKGVYLYSKGEEYLDLGAGIAVNALGHCHPKMVEALTKQAQKLWHVSNIYNVDELNNYAEKLVEASFADFVFFCNSGAEAIEAVIKTIRRHFYVKNQAHKNRIITFSGAFHGRTIATISAAGKERYLEGFKPALEGFDNVEFGNLDAVKTAINENSAGILIEPIQGEEGVRVASKEFLQALRKLCDEHGLLLAFDEVQCGMGRTGKLFAYDYYDVKPDLIGCAKAIGGGFPLGACLTTKNASIGMTAGVHGTTYGGNPLAMAVASSVLDEILSPNFLQNVSDVGMLFKAELVKLKSEFPEIIEEVRGVGLMLGVKIKDSISNSEIVEKMIKNKVLTIPAGNNVIRLIPPLILQKEHVLQGIERIKKSLR